jgi:hypothetical protein
MSPEEVNTVEIPLTKGIKFISWIVNIVFKEKLGLELV